MGNPYLHRTVSAEISKGGVPGLDPAIEKVQDVIWNSSRTQSALCLSPVLTQLENCGDVN